MEINTGGDSTFDASNGSMSQDDHDNNVAMAIKSREEELYHYRINAQNYKAMYDALPHKLTPWPPHLRAYATMTRDQMAANIIDDDDLYLASDLSYRDELRFRIRAETMEGNKIEVILKSLVSQCADIEKIRAIIATKK